MFECAGQFDSVSYAKKKAAEEKNPSVLDTGALATYELGKKYIAQAVTYQKKAVALTHDEQGRKGLKKALERYESASVE